MNVKVHIKTPDVIDYTLSELGEDEDRAREVIGKFVKYGECMTIEFDLDTGTAKVLEVGR
jgi:hypothetical protein